MIIHSSPINRLTLAGVRLSKLRKLAIAQGVNDKWIDVRTMTEDVMHDVDMAIKEIAEQEARF